MKSPLYNKIKNNSPGKIITSFTAGNFDLLHPGYIYTFEEAKRHSDKFIVFLQRDPSSTRYTKYKPVIPYYERYKTLMAIKYVEEARSDNDVLHLVNPDALDTAGVIAFMKAADKGNPNWKFVDFAALNTKANRSNCTLDVTKLKEKYDYEPMTESEALALIYEKSFV